GIQSFCTQDCKFEHFRGKKPKSTSNPMPPRLRESVMRKDSNRCRACRSRNGLDVHHIYYKSQGGPHEASNLITLCKECHIPIVHADKKRFQPLCLGIVWLREVYGDRHMTLYQLERKIDA